MDSRLYLSGRIDWGSRKIYTNSSLGLKILFLALVIMVWSRVVIGSWNGQVDKTWEEVMRSLLVRSLVRCQPWNGTEEWSSNEQR